MASFDELAAQIKTKSGGDDSDGGFLAAVGKNVSNAKDIVTGQPQGLFDTGKDILETARGIAQIPGTIAGGVVQKFGADDDTVRRVGELVGGPVAAASPLASLVNAVNGGEDARYNEQVLFRNDPENRRETFKQWVPFVADMEQSFENTAGRVWQASPVGGVSNLVRGEDYTNPYLQAAAEGNLPSVVVEDAGNLAAVAEIGAGGLSKTAQAARLGEAAQAGRPALFGSALEQRVGTRLAGQADVLEQAARSLGTGAEAANKVAGAPFLPVKLAGKAVSRVPVVQNRVLPFLAEQAARRDVRGSLSRDASARATVELNDIAPQVEQARQLLPDTAEQEAMTLAIDKKINANNIDAVEAFLAGADEQTAQRVLPDVTPEGLAVYRQYLNGDADLVSRIDEAIAVTAPMRDLLAGRLPDAQWGGRLDDYGTRGLGARTPEAQQAVTDRRLEEAGTAPMFSRIDAAIEDPQTAARRGVVSKGTAKRIAREQDRLNRAVVEGDSTAARKAQAALDDVRDELARDPLFAPPNQRPQLVFNQRLQEAIRAEADRVGGAAGAQLAGLGDGLETVLADLSILADEHLIGGTPPPATGLFGTQRVNPLTREIKTQKVRAGATAERSIEGQAVQVVKERYDQHRNQVIREAVTEVGVPASALGGDLPSILAAADAAGLVPYDPDVLGRPLKPSQVDTDSVFVPRHVLSAIDDLQKVELKPGALKAVVTASDKTVSAWKKFVLPLSPKWNVGNLIGNSMMAASVPGAMSLTSFLEARDLRKRPTYEAAQVLGQGFADELADSGLPSLASAAEQHGRIRTALEAIPKAGYKGNQFIDDMGHLMVLSAKLREGAKIVREADDLLAEGRISQAWADELKAKAPTPEDAVKQALKTMGEFSNMSKVQREGIRRVMPFFPWYRHITELAWRLPMENPYRVAWTLHLGQLHGEQEDRPDWLKGSVKVGDTYVRAPWNPFPGGVESPLFTPQGIAGGLNPAIQWGSAAAGLNLGRWRPVTRAPSRSGKSNVVEPLEPAQFLGYMTNQLPQTRLFADLTSKDVVRTDTREPLFGAGGRPIALSNQDVGPVPAPLFQFLTGATFDQPDLEASDAREAKQRKSGRKARAKYETRRRQQGV